MEEVLSRRSDVVVGSVREERVGAEGGQGLHLFNEVIELRNVLQSGSA
jgi:hypothetical protein